MRKLLLLSTLAVLLGPPAAVAVTKTVAITNAGFVPNTITITAGDSITWTNSDTRNHQPISQDRDASFASPILRPGESFTFQFTKDGRYTITDALVSGSRMAVVVRKAAAPRAPTLAANRRKVVYGGGVTLTGKLPVAAVQPVTLRAEVVRPNGTRETSTVGQTTTDGTGAFTFRNVPTAQTTYTVLWNVSPPAAAVASNAVTVRVAPRIGLALVRKVGRRVTFSTKATSAIPYAGRYVLLQRRNALGQWVSLRRVVLKSNSVATRAAARLPRGLSRIRVVMPQSQVGAGYVRGVSRVILVRL